MIGRTQGEYDSWQMCCDAGYETKDSKLDATINAWGAKLTGLVHTNLLGPNPKHGIFLDSCLHHCGGWGEYEIDGMVQGPAFQKWYVADAVCVVYTCRRLIDLPLIAGTRVAPGACISRGRSTRARPAASRRAGPTSLSEQNNACTEAVRIAVVMCVVESDVAQGSGASVN